MALLGEVNGGLKIFKFIYSIFSNGERPILDIQITLKNRSSSPKGISQRSLTGKKPPYDPQTLVHIFNVSQKFEIIITNNSEVMAFYPELYVDSKIKYIKLKKNNAFKPIKSGDSLVVEGEYNGSTESLPCDRQITEKKDFEERIKEFSLMLIYENKKRNEFFSIWSYSQGMISHNKPSKKTRKEFIRL